MDTKKTVTNPQTPAQLWIGPHEHLVSKTVLFLQKQLCPHACGVCVACHQIRQHQHHSVLWFYPEKHYTKKDFTSLFTRISFSLDEHQQFFFVIQKAEALSGACANSLLKSIEEPPPGYQFIFLTHRPNQVLPTIRSRCIATMHYTDHNQINHQELFELFTRNEKPSPLTFLQALDASQITERETQELLDNLLNHWVQRYKEAVESGNAQQKKRASSLLTLLQKSLTKLPMPGSSKLFWRNLYLQIPFNT